MFDWVIIAWVGFLILFFALLGYWLGRNISERFYAAKLDEWKKEYEKSIRKDAVERSRAVLGGKFSEQLAPYFPDFNYDPTEVRFIGSPVDFIVFKGTGVNEPEEIVFVEVKTGKSNLSENERKLKEIVENKKVRWEMYYRG
ncbi:MAG: Holliday junction resolvase-like protein [Thermoplasmatales archaeon]|nr:Holliday junction resolvase-like protein [Thermoplasmatales archaeon]